MQVLFCVSQHGMMFHISSCHARVDSKEGNNNNKAFKSQTSRGRLELKPIRSNQGKLKIPINRAEGERFRHHEVGIDGITIQQTILPSYNLVSFLPFFTIHGF